MIDQSTPIIEIERPRGADDIARCIVAIALSCVGLTGRQGTRARFGDQIGPRNAPESDRVANAKSRAAITDWLKKPFGGGGPSTCGMVGESFHAQLGAGVSPAETPPDHVPIAATLYRPYVPGTSVSRAVGYMQDMGAWHDAQRQADIEPRPQLACYVVIGCTAPKGWTGPWDFGGVEHVRTVVGWDGDVMISVDGGCVDPVSGLQAIHLVRSRLVLRRGHPWLVKAEDEHGNDLDPSKAPGRRILGWGDPGLMLWRDDMRQVLVPQGWESVEV